MSNLTENIQASVAKFAADFDTRLASLIDARATEAGKLGEAVRYALLSPGKRLRPFLVMRCCALAGGDAKQAFAPGAALEMVHAFSLVHDDLPAMDDDDLRRGRPTCHKQFDEATAILAGDALLALAFETLVSEVSNSGASAALVVELARATGWLGMIGGQSDDLEGEQYAPNLDRVRTIHERKTAALFVAACRMGGITAQADADKLDQLGRFGRHLGLAFQIADDLLDVTGDAAELGKEVAKDAARRKQTFPACVGIEQAMQVARHEVDAAVSALAGFGSAADDLRGLATYIVDRRS